MIRPLLMMILLVAMSVRPIRAEARRGLQRAPESAPELINPHPSSLDVRAGAKLFARYCAECHGQDGRGGRRGPALDGPSTRAAPEGVVFWYLTNGDLAAGMPSWSRLPEAQRWQLAAFLNTPGDPFKPRPSRDW